MREPHRGTAQFSFSKMGLSPGTVAGRGTADGGGMSPKQFSLRLYGSLPTDLLRPRCLVNGYRFPTSLPLAILAGLEKEP